MSYLDYGARMYDSRIGRWHSIDPKAESYLNVGGYVYCANNPIMLIDPTGERIDLSAVQEYDRIHNTSYADKLLLDLLMITGLDLYIDTVGFLEWDEVVGAALDKAGNMLGSALARDIILNAIKHEKIVTAVIDFEISTRYKIKNKCISLNPEMIDKTIMGATGLDDRTMGYGMTFLHEILHSEPGGMLKDTPNSLGNPGPVEQQLNIVRDELNEQGGNFGQRMSYDPFYIKGTGTFIVPFSARKLIELESGLINSGASKYIKFRR